MGFERTMSTGTGFALFLSSALEFYVYLDANLFNFMALDYSILLGYLLLGKFFLGGCYFLLILEKEDSVTSCHSIVFTQKFCSSMVIVYGTFFYHVSLYLSVVFQIVCILFSFFLKISFIFWNGFRLCRKKMRK